MKTGDEMSIGQKLKHLIEIRQTNVNKLAKSAQVSPQTIYGIIKRDNTKVDIRILQALAHELNTTLEYFATGQIDATTIEEQELIGSYQRLDPYGRKAVRAIAEVEHQRVQSMQSTESQVIDDFEEELSIED